MDDKKRTKILAVGLAAVVGIYSLRSTVDGIVMKPIRDLQTKLSVSQNKSETLQLEKIQLLAAKRNLEDWRTISLPPNVDDAQRLFREWVYELTRQCGFSGPAFEVIPGSRSLQKEYSTVSVEVKKAETDLQGLTNFLYLFDQADILHRISFLSIDSPGAQGNPRLVVSLTAEGMSVVGGEDRQEMLTRSTLSGKVTESTTDLVVVPHEAFPVWEPFEPFLIRVDRELLRVESVSEAGWKVKRGVAGTKATAHYENAIVELLPVAWDRKDRALADYTDFVKGSFFVIPSPPKTYNPRLAGVADKTIKPGEEVKFTARAESLDPALGEPQFSLADAAEGMTIDPKTGEFVWKPTDATASGKYLATILLTQPNNADLKLNSKLTITIREVNAPPELTLPTSAVVVIERDFALTASAKDDGPAESLKFSLGGGAPEGLTVDAKTGQLKWTPARTFIPGKYDVEVKVTDAGEDPKTTSKKITLEVRDDSAALTLLSAALSKDDVWFAWFRNKGTGKTEQLKVGEKLSVSEIEVEIVSVTNRYVTMKDSDGLWKLSLGDTLRSRELIEPAPKTETPPAEEPAVKDAPAKDATDENLSGDDAAENLTKSAGDDASDQAEVPATESTTPLEEPAETEAPAETPEDSEDAGVEPSTPATPEP